MPVNRRHFLAGTLSVAAAGAATACAESRDAVVNAQQEPAIDLATATVPFDGCLLYTSDAADDVAGV